MSPFQPPAATVLKRMIISPENCDRSKLCRVKASLSQTGLALLLDQLLSILFSKLSELSSCSLASSTTDISTCASVLAPWLSVTRTSKVFKPKSRALAVPDKIPSEVRFNQLDAEMSEKLILSFSVSLAKVAMILNN